MAGKYNGATSAEVALTVRSSSDVIASLENKIGALENIDTSDLASLPQIKQDIADLKQAMADAEAALERRQPRKKWKRSKRH